MQGQHRCLICTVPVYFSATAEVLHVEEPPNFYAHRPCLTVDYRMNFLDYQHGTATTAIYPGAGDMGSVTGLSYVTLGLTGEAGEIANKVKKILRDSNGEITTAHRTVLAAELGDILWYVSQLATQLGVPLEDIARQNLSKLADRKERGTLGGSGDTR